MKSPETYVGYNRADNFVSPGGIVEDENHDYAAAPLAQSMGSAGDWTVGAESAALKKPDGGIAFRFHARDLHLVLGPGGRQQAGPLRVSIDGAAPGDNHGADTDADGRGVSTDSVCIS